MLYGAPVLGTVTESLQFSQKSSFTAAPLRGGPSLGDICRPMTEANTPGLSCLSQWRSGKLGSGGHSDSRV